MKHTLILIIISFVISFQLVASTDPINDGQNSIISWENSSLNNYKAEFDIESALSGNALHKSAGIGLSGQELKNDVSEMTLIQGGFFTIGTHNGLSSSELDNQCGITFGHPYALTSYPLIAIDGQWGKLTSVFDIFQTSPVVQDNSLQLVYEQAGLSGASGGSSRFDHCQALADRQRVVFFHERFDEDAVGGSGQIDGSRPGQHLEQRIPLGDAAPPANQPQADRDRLVVDTQLRQDQFPARHGFPVTISPA